MGLCLGHASQTAAVGRQRHTVSADCVHVTQEAQIGHVFLSSRGAVLNAYIVWVAEGHLERVLLLQVELEIMLPEEMSVKESHDIALMLQHKVPVCIATFIMLHLTTSELAWLCLNPRLLTTVD